MVAPLGYDDQACFRTGELQRPEPREVLAPRGLPVPKERYKKILAPHVQGACFIFEAMDKGLMAVLEGSEWKVFCALAKHLPRAYPSRKRLAKLCGCSESTVDRALKQLGRRGV